MIRNIERFVSRIKNLIRWLPVIWKDQDWDHHYIFEIIKFKLKNQSKYITEKNRHTRAKRDGEMMMTCVRLIDKVSEEYYNCEYMDYHDCSYDFIKIPGTDSYELEINEKSEHFDDFFKKYPRIYKQFYNVDLPKNKIAFLISRENHNRARKLLFKIMEERIEGWWD